MFRFVGLSLFCFSFVRRKEIVHARMGHEPRRLKMYVDCDKRLLLISKYINTLFTLLTML